MKKIVVGLITWVISCSVYAETVVEIVWPFSIASPPAKYLRLVISQANDTQSDYKFILSNRPGAGGSIAAKAVIGATRPTLLANTNAFFVRRYLYPKDSYQFDNFKPVSLLGSAPLGFVSRGNLNWNDIVTKKEIFVGTNGAGSLSHVLAENLKNTYPQVILVPYPGPTEALKDVRGGQIDLVIDVPSVAPPDQSLVKIHSITGVDNYNGRFTLLSKKVDKNFEFMSVDFFIMAPASMDPKLVDRLQVILNQAITNNNQLAEAYRVDTVSLKSVDVKKWYQDNIEIWKKFTEKIQISE
jgi:hypothetical protein